MPWQLQSKDGQWCVVKTGEDSPVPGGCHASRADAIKHQRALYANESRMASIYAELDAQPDPDPETDVWNVQVEDHGMTYRLPLLIRGGLDWEYKGATHEWLDAQGRKVRPVLGLTVTHHADGSNRESKLERDLELLLPGVEASDPRDTFYAAETPRFLGRTDEAIAMYTRRLLLAGWDEELFYAKYQRAKLRGDVNELVATWRTRPHRHEPLQAAADLVAAQGAQDDMLFLSPPGKAF